MTILHKCSKTHGRCLESLVTGWLRLEAVRPICQAASGVLAGSPGVAWPEPHSPWVGVSIDRSFASRVLDGQLPKGCAALGTCLEAQAVRASKSAGSLLGPSPSSTGVLKPKPRESLWGLDAARRDIKSAQPISSFIQALRSQAIRNEREALATWTWQSRKPSRQQVAQQKAEPEFKLSLLREGETVTTRLGDQARSERQQKL